VKAGKLVGESAVQLVALWVVGLADWSDVSLVAWMVEKSVVEKVVQSGD